MAITTPNQDQVSAPQFVVCPRCGTPNRLTASYCMNCGTYLPPPVGHPLYPPVVTQPKADTGLSVPAILLIVSVLLLVIVLAFLMIAFAV